MPDHSIASGSWQRAPRAWVNSPDNDNTVVFGQRVETKYGSPTLRELATHVAALLRCQTFPVTGKSPAAGHAWLDAQRKTPGAQKASEAAWESATGYGILALPGDGLYVVDSDSLLFLSRLLTEFPGLLQSTPVVFSGDVILASQGHCQIVLRLTLSTPLDGPLSLREDGKEVASLRGHGSYGIGPLSLHPSGQPYTSNSVSKVRRLNAAESAKLLALFAPRSDQSRAYRINTAARRESDIGRVEAILRARGYKPNKKPNKAWLNGRCLFGENHKNHDEHSSGGFNTVSGVWHCFACGDHPLSQVMAALRLSAPEQPTSGRSYTFVGQLPPPDGEVAEIEVNLAVELFRRGQYQSARFFEVLRDYSRAHGGVRTFRTRDCVAIGAEYRMSANDVKNALRQLTRAALLKKPGRGLYVRVGVVEAQRLLGLGSEYAAARVPRSALLGSPSDYCKAVLLSVEAYLPSGHSSHTISQAAGRSVRSLYYHENALGVVREPQIERVGIATASGPSFFVVSDAQGQRVMTLGGREVQGACEVATGVGGIPWAFTQKPSVRRLPEGGNSFG